jgi:hypothetical protein
MTHQHLDSDITRESVVPGIPNAKQKQYDNLPQLNAASIGTDDPGDVDPSKGYVGRQYFSEFVATYDQVACGE